MELLEGAALELELHGGNFHLNCGRETVLAASYGGKRAPSRPTNVRKKSLASSLETSVNILLAFNLLIIIGFISMAGVALGILSWKSCTVAGL